MKKADRIALFLGQIPTPDAATADLHPCCAGYVRLFNAQRYYEAHDVLEHLWLQTRGPARSCYKGLIQIAGAFVHLQKQHARPDHPKDGKRLRPAVRLFELGMRNIAPFRPEFSRFDLDSLSQLCADHARRIVSSDFTRNPWSPATAPHIDLKAARA